MGSDATCEWIAAHVGEVVVKEIRRSLGIVGPRGPDHLRVMPFPIHLMARKGVNGPTTKCVEICDRKPELGVGENSKLEQHSRLAAVERLLGLAVARRRLQRRREGTTVILDGDSESRRARRVRLALPKGFIHGTTVNGWPDETLRWC